MITLDLIDDAGVVQRPRSAVTRVALGPFGRWLDAQGLGARDITEALIDAYRQRGHGAGTGRHPHGSARTAGRASGVRRSANPSLSMREACTSDC